MADIKQVLADFVSTFNSIESNSMGDFGKTLGKFPELTGYDQKLLKDYISNVNHYGGDIDLVNKKFPEFFQAPFAAPNKFDFSGTASKKKVQAIQPEESESKSEDTSSEFSGKPEGFYLFRDPFEVLRSMPKKYNPEQIPLATDEEKANIAETNKYMQELVLPAEAIKDLEANKVKTPITTATGSSIALRGDVGSEQSFVEEWDKSREQKWREYYALDPIGRVKYAAERQALETAEKDLLSREKELLARKAKIGDIVSSKNTDTEEKRSMAIKTHRQKASEIDFELKEIEEAKASIQDYKDGIYKGSLSEVLGQFRRKGGKAIVQTATLGMLDLYDELMKPGVMAKMDDIQKEEYNQTRANAKALIDSYGAEKTVPQEAAGVFLHSLPYMAEFATLGGLAKKATGKIGLELVKKSIGSGMKAGALSKPVARSLAVTTDVVDATLRSAVMASLSPSTYAEALRYKNGTTGYEIDENNQIVYTGQEDALPIGKALLKSAVVKIIENVSEMSGIAFSKMGKKLFPALNKWVNNPKIKNSELDDFVKTIGFNGTFNEFLEEQVATPLHAIFDGTAEFSDMFDPRQQLITLLGVAMPGAGFAMTGYGMNKAQQVAAKAKYRAARWRMFDELNKEGNISEDLLSTLSNDVLPYTSPDDMVSVVTRALGGEELTQEQQDAVDVFGRAVNNYKAISPRYRRRLEVESETRLKIRDDIKEANPDMDEKTLNNAVYLQYQINKLEGNKTVPGKLKKREYEQALNELLGVTEVAPEETATISPAKETTQSVEQKRAETEAKIKRKDLFADGGVFANRLGGSGVDSIPTSHEEIDGIEFVQFSNPNTGEVDVVMTGTTESDFVGFYRIYENGKATNRWSSKFENQSRNKGNFKTMLSNAQRMLPEGHEYTEKTSISTDGLRVWRQQLDRGYQVLEDKKGKIKTNRVAINGDAITNILGIPVKRGNFDNIKVTNQDDFNKAKAALTPYMVSLGLSADNIYYANGTIEIDLPILISKSKQNAIQEPTATESVLRNEQPQMGLQEVGEGNAQEQTITQEVQQEEVAPDVIVPEGEKAPVVSQKLMESAGVTLPDTKVMVVDDVMASIDMVYDEAIKAGIPQDEAEEMRDAVTNMAAGNAVFRRDGTPFAIVVNKDQANSRTLGHELWHPLLSKAFNDNETEMAKFVAQIDQRLRAAGYSDIADKLRRFAAQYKKEGLEASEYMAEFGGYLSDEMANLERLGDQKKLSAFKKFIMSLKDYLNKLSQKLFKKPIFSEKAKEEDIVDLMMATSKQMKAGQKAEFKPKAEPVVDEAREYVASRQQKAEQVKPKKSKTGYEAISGYERMMTVIDGIIAKAYKRAKTEDNVRAYTDALAYMQGSKVYEDATDSQREELVISLRKKLGQKVTPSPMLRRITGEVKDITKITMHEADALAIVIKREAAAAKTAIKAQKEITAKLIKELKDYVKRGKITQRQALNALNRLNKTNLFNDEAVDGFVEYMVAVFNKADHAQKLRDIDAKRKDALKAVNTKLGAAKELIPILRKILPIKAHMIPLEKLDTFKAIVDILAANKAVLELPDIEILTSLSADVLNIMNEKYSVLSALRDIFAVSENLVFDEDGKVDFPASVDAMFKAGEITESDKDLMRTRGSRDIVMGDLKETKEPKTDEEKALEREANLDYIKANEIEPERLANRDDRDAAKGLAKSIATNGLDALSDQDIKRLAAVIDNINAGYFPSTGLVLKEKIGSNNRGLKVFDVFRIARIPSVSELHGNLRAWLIRSDKGAARNIIDSLPKNNLDMALGVFSGRDLTNNTVKPIAEAYAIFKTQYDSIVHRLDKAIYRISRDFGYDNNKVQESKMRMMVYMLQREYESNIINGVPDKQVSNPIDIIDATIAVYKDGQKVIKGWEKSVEAMEAVKEKYKVTIDGVEMLDSTEMLKDFKPSEKAAIKLFTAIADELKDKSIYTSAVIRGSAIKPLNNWVHHITLETADDMKNTKGLSDIQEFQKRFNPSTRAGAFVERDGKVHAMHLDAFSAVEKGAKGVLLDYNLTSPIRETKRTMNVAFELMQEENKKKETALSGKELEKSRKEWGKKRKMFNAVKEAIDETINETIINAFTSVSGIDKVLASAESAGYKAMLASSVKFIAEFTANFSGAIQFAPKEFLRGMTDKNITSMLNSDDGVQFMNNIKFAQQQRLYPSMNMDSKMVDTSEFKKTPGTGGGYMVSNAKNKLMIAEAYIKKSTVAPAAMFADFMISTPDKVIARPVAFGLFFQEFERITGVAPDKDKIVANDEAYMDQYADAIQAASEYANEMSVRISATANPFLGIAKNLSSNKDRHAITQLFIRFNRMFTGFMVFEHVAAVEAVHNILARPGNMTMRRGRAAMLLAAITARGTLYMYLMKTGSLMISNFWLSMMGGPDDDDANKDQEKATWKMLTQSFMNYFSSIMFGRYFGNIVRGSQSYFMETLNKKYFDFLREDGQDYDMYRDAISMGYIPDQDKVKGSNMAWEIAKNFMGPLGPFVKMVDATTKSLGRLEGKKQKTRTRGKEELLYRTPLELFGTLGYVPLYRDVRNLVLTWLYKSNRTSGENSMTDEQIKKMLEEKYK